MYHAGQESVLLVCHGGVGHYWRDHLTTLLSTTATFATSLSAFASTIECHGDHVGALFFLGWTLSFIVFLVQFGSCSHVVESKGSFVLLSK
jgi:hypothetical protein